MNHHSRNLVGIWFVFDTIYRKAFQIFQSTTPVRLVAQWIVNFRSFAEFSMITFTIKTLTTCNTMERPFSFPIRSYSQDLASGWHILSENINAQWKHLKK